MPSLLSVAPSTIVARLATGDLKDATPAEINTLLGTVVGPGSAVDNALVRFDLATGKLVQSSLAILDDTGALSGLTTLGMSGNLTVGGTVDGRDVAADGIILDGIEPGADITDEANVVAALDGATLANVAPAPDDKVLILDTSDADNLKYADAQDIAGLTGGVLFMDTTGVGTDADTAVKDLISYVLPANTLDVNGKGIRITAWGTTAANGNNKSITLVAPGANILGVGPTAANDIDWAMQVTYIRTGPNTQDVFVNYGFWNSAITPNHYWTMGDDLSTALTFKVTGQNGTASANDVVCQGMSVELLN